MVKKRKKRTKKKKTSSSLATKSNTRATAKTSRSNSISKSY